VLDMFDAFARRSLPEYLASFDPEFLFTSDDTTCRTNHPVGMSLADEAQYAGALLAGEGEQCTGLPHATHIQMTLRWLSTRPEHPTGNTATVTIEGLRVRIDLSDGDCFDTGEARHELLLVRSPDGWRVRRWTEVEADSQATSDTAALAGADSSAVAGPAFPDRLGVIAFADHSLNAMIFRVGLPRAGGVLEMFDVQGRRVASRDLEGLRPGYHRVSLDGGSYPAGIYWARVRQGEDAATVRVVWVR
jgi:hypothetical protein